MRSLLLSLSILLISLSTNASHIVGGEVYYDSLGNDQYRVVFEIYRDCSGAAFDDPLRYTVFNADGTIYAEYAINLPTPDTLPIIYDDPCVTPPNDVCIERAIYIDTVTLPTTPDGYYITYQRCCWATNIQNITQPGDWGITITTDVPGSNLVSEDNNSARYNNYPPIVLCSGQTLTFDHSATDIDGDSLVYSMCTPQTMNIGVGAEPNPEAAAPYADVPWDVGFSGTVPFGPGSNITIDPQTGMMDITPNQIGTFVAAVCVEEYRDGVLINSKSRTFGYRVVVCDVIEPMQVDVLGQGELIEDCQSAGFIVSRDDSTDAVNLQIFLSGTATNGVDYNFLPDTLTLPANVGTDTILITPTLDGIIEGDEDLVFNIVVENICDGTFDTTTAYITILDYIDMAITSEDSINVCDETGEYGLIWCNVSHGAPPYNYAWFPTPYANNDTIVFPATDLEPNLNLMYVEVYDQCGKTVSSQEIKVYNRCPLNPPNVITANLDNVNDNFIIGNLEDYDKVHLIILNRWGNVVYENEDYQNDWQGNDMNGNELTEGVYTFMVTPESTKFIYDDEERSKYTAHGIVHIIRD
jgi:gliding motility-associated-like protein